MVECGDWYLERRGSGCLYWCRPASKVKFRCDVEVREFWPAEKECHEAREEPQASALAAAFCLAAIALVLGFNLYCQA